MSAAKPNYVRPMDLHAHTGGCDDTRADGSSYCIPVYTAADYEVLLARRDALIAALEELTTLARAYQAATYSSLTTKAVNEQRQRTRETFIAHGVKRLPAESIEIATKLLKAAKGEV